MKPVPQYKVAKGHTQYLILELIHLNGKISRVNLASKTGLSAAAVTQITNKLLSEQLIKEVGFDENARRGRKPVLLEINHDAQYIIGVDVGYLSLRACIADLRGRILDRRERPFDIINQWECLPQEIETLVTSLRQTASEAAIPIAGLGIVTPGHPRLSKVTEIKAKTELYRPPFDWTALPLVDIMQEKTGLPTLVANATDGAALAETWFGSARSVSRLIYLTIGSGVKASVISNGELDADQEGHTLEFGHTTIDVNGPLCRCGNKGCLELYISRSALLEVASDAMRNLPSDKLDTLCGGDVEKLTVNHVFEASLYGDEAAVKTLTYLIKYLGAGIVNLVNMFSPDLILMGTREMPVEKLDQLIDPIEKMVQQRSYSKYLGEKVKFGTGSFGGDAYLVGAVTLIAKALFSPLSDLRII